mmetsp:Transcript_9409/g.38530  ORF Transcript_9409/g.38530 Transcript_9409/m.38530 type:complete len:123 (-) Transcript_9409:134-502(-)
MASAQAIAEAFVKHYYHLFDTNRAATAALYTDQSMLTFEGKETQGVAAIVEKLTESLSFKQVRHEVATMDVQPCPGNGILVVVTGMLQADQDNAFRFSQAFTLMPGANNSFFVLNDVFRLSF